MYLQNILVMILHNNITEPHFGAATHEGQYSAAVSIVFSARMHARTHTEDTNDYSEY